MGNLIANYEEAVAIILFGIGFSTLLFHRNLIKKIIGLNIMDTGVYLFLASMGYIYNKAAPILTDLTAEANVADYINPIPSALVLTGIVVSVSVTAISLALSVRLYKKYHTLNLDEIYMKAVNQEKEVF
jgi:multicomponent Na+:H+ antiporter subunit C